MEAYSQRAERAVPENLKNLDRLVTGERLESRGVPCS
jgi:hypothetical protein